MHSLVRFLALGGSDDDETTTEGKVVTHNANSLKRAGPPA